MQFRISSRLSRPRACRIYRCSCGRPLFFQNSACLGCGAPLGYAPTQGKRYPLTRSPLAAICQIPDGQRKFIRRCANLNLSSACDRIFPARENEEGITLYLSCRLNRTIPDLSVAENGENWRPVELAKLRLISSLVALGSPLASRISEDSERGLTIDLLRPLSDDPPVVTGHCLGIVTLSVEEAHGLILEPQ